MAPSSTQPGPTANNPASNGRPHESASVSNGNNEHWSKELLQDMDAMMKRMDFMRDDLSKIQDEVVTLRRSFGDIHKLLNDLKELVAPETGPDAST
ncbi:uncharacterized protein N7496_007822 [Penicillium cataractarum]|uniref:Uncharacterized protein n=1 Tax=Penicillium cataractarum TaxID=2100454 RepID=A0A9W9RX52_9EURO|nr:uncharacterized protein N7496_007822 [Penicillium cataractarum]KAJ5368062.1 hypothetical protein N7496_007822 [Penicillium cataractarum]